MAGAVQIQSVQKKLCFCSRTCYTTNGSGRRNSGWILRSGLQPLFFGRTIKPLPLKLAGAPRNLLRTTSKSSLTGLPRTYRPIGVATRSAICNPAILSLLGKHCRPDSRCKIFAPVMKSVPFLQILLNTPIRSLLPAQIRDNRHPQAPSRDFQTHPGTASPSVM
jgi:hypothetical protein